MSGKVTVRWVAVGSVQVGTRPDDIITYGVADATGLGTTAELPDDIARLLIYCGYAEPVRKGGR